MYSQKKTEFTSLNNWRSLLTVDYTIAIKAIAIRIKNVTSSVVHDSQPGFFKDRYIWENIRHTYDLIQTLNETNKLAWIIFADVFFKNI